MEYMRALKDLRSRMDNLAVGKEPSIPAQGYVPQRPMSQPEKTGQDILAESQAWLSEIRDQAAKARREAPKPSGSFAEGFASTYSRRPKKRPVEGDSTAERAEKIAPLIARRGERPSDYAPDSSRDEPIPVDAEVSNVLDAIAAVESKGSGDYSAVGPKVTKGMYKGQHAYGRYQVMEGNIGPWSEEALGRRLTKDEFMADPKAQDAIAAHRLQLAKDKHGTWEDAASVWFSGQPMAKAGNASDDYLNVPQYINKFRRNFVRA